MRGRARALAATAFGIKEMIGRTTARHERQSVVSDAIKRPGAARANPIHKDRRQRSVAMTIALVPCRLRIAATAERSRPSNQQARSVAGNTDNRRDSCRSARNGALSSHPSQACDSSRAFRACRSGRACPLTSGMARPSRRPQPTTRGRKPCLSSAPMPAAAQRSTPPAASCVGRMAFAPTGFYPMRERCALERPYDDRRSSGDLNLSQPPLSTSMCTSLSRHPATCRSTSVARGRTPVATLPRHSHIHVHQRKRLRLQAFSCYDIGAAWSDVSYG